MSTAALFRISPKLETQQHPNNKRSSKSYSGMFHTMEHYAATRMHNMMHLTGVTQNKRTTRNVPYLYFKFYNRQPCSTVTGQNLFARRRHQKDTPDTLPPPLALGYTRILMCKNSSRCAFKVCAPYAVLQKIKLTKKSVCLMILNQLSSISGGNSSESRPPWDHLLLGTTCTFLKEALQSRVRPCPARPQKPGKGEECRCRRHPAPRALCGRGAPGSGADFTV